MDDAIDWDNLRVGDVYRLHWDALAPRINLPVRQRHANGVVTRITKNAITISS